MLINILISYKNNNDSNKIEILCVLTKNNINILFLVYINITYFKNVPCAFNQIYFQQY